MPAAIAAAAVAAPKPPPASAKAALADRAASFPDPSVDVPRASGVPAGTDAATGMTVSAQPAPSKAAPPKAPAPNNTDAKADAPPAQSPWAWMLGSVGAAMAAPLAAGYAAVSADAVDDTAATAALAATGVARQSAHGAATRNLSRAATVQADAGSDEEPDATSGEAPPTGAAPTATTSAARPDGKHAATDLKNTTAAEAPKATTPEPLPLAVTPGHPDRTATASQDAFSNAAVTNIADPLAAGTTRTESPAGAAAPAQIAMGALDLSQTAWPTAMAEHVQWQLQDGVQEARLELHPRELGSLQVHVRLSGNEAQVQFVTQHPQVRDALNAGMPQLRAMLADGGMQLSQAQVGTQGQPQRQAREPQGGGTSAMADEDGAPATVLPRTLRIGLVDDFA